MFLTAKMVSCCIYEMLRKTNEAVHDRYDQIYLTFGQIQVFISLYYKAPRITTSVTRFGTISPFWPKLKLIWQHFEALFSIWHNFESALANFVCFWANVYCCEQPYNEKINLTAGHQWRKSLVDSHP